MTELKPCPFCGGQADYYSGEDWWQASCTKCHAATFPANSQDQATVYWNNSKWRDSDGE